MFARLQRHLAIWDVERRVRRHGWTAIYVGDYQSVPTWVYSVGLDETLDQPEIILFDVTQADANDIFWQAFRELKSGALALEDGAEWRVEGDRIGVWRKVDPSQIDGPEGWLAAAVGHRERRTGRRHGLEAFQLVLADADHRMPWEAGYDERLRMRQPALYLPADDWGDAPLSPPDREALRVAKERGWSIMRVDGPGLKWAYTIGLSDGGGPELIAFLPSADMAANILHETQAFVARGDLALEDGLRWNGPGFDCCWRRVHESQYLALNVFFLAKLRHEARTGRREALPAFQLFLPDHQGRYPWEPGCEAGVRNTQPLLCEPFDPGQLRRGPLAALMRV
jgi:hypothetical protein